MSKKTIIIIVASVVALAIIAGVVIYRKNKATEREAAEAEKQLAEAEKTGLFASLLTMVINKKPKEIKA